MKKFLLVFIMAAGSLIFAADYEVGDHDLFVMPTAYTMPAGSSYFSDYELFFVNYSRAINDRTHLALFSLFPISTGFMRTVVFGAKHNYLKRSKLALAGWLAYAPDGQILNFGNVFSLGETRKSVHLGVSALHEIDSDIWEYLFMLGGRMAFTSKTDLILEFENTNSLIQDDFKGLIAFGFRFKGQNVAWDIAGVRPLWEDTGKLIMLPLIKATVYFGK